MSKRVWVLAVLAAIGLLVGAFLARVERLTVEESVPAASQPDAAPPMDRSDVPTIDAEELQAELKSDAPPVLVDVREPFEHDSAAIQGDTNIPLRNLELRVDELPKDKLIVVYCRRGNRSAQATVLLKAKGYTNVKSLDGGIEGWAHKIDPAMKICC